MSRRIRNNSVTSSGPTAAESGKVCFRLQAVLPPLLPPCLGPQRPSWDSTDAKRFRFVHRGWTCRCKKSTSSKRKPYVPGKNVRIKGHFDAEQRGHLLVKPSWYRRADPVCALRVCGCSFGKPEIFAADFCVGRVLHGCKLTETLPRRWYFRESIRKRSCQFLGGLCQEVPDKASRSAASM